MVYIIVLGPGINYCCSINKGGCFVAEIKHYPYLINIFMRRRIPADTKRCNNVGLTLAQRRRRWTNGKSTLIQRIVSAGMTL